MRRHDIRKVKRNRRVEQQLLVSQSCKISLLKSISIDVKEHIKSISKDIKEHKKSISMFDDYLEMTGSLPISLSILKFASTPPSENP